MGAYLGLTSRRWQSGEVDYGGRISKMGDSLMRSLLYQAANGLLTRVRRAHPLKDWARKLKKRTSHKKACVALARKLAVILHKMLITGEPFRWPQIRGCQNICVSFSRHSYCFGNWSAKRMANWFIAAFHSFNGIFHFFSAFRNAR